MALLDDKDIKSLVDKVRVNDKSVDPICVQICNSAQVEIKSSLPRLRSSVQTMLKVKHEAITTYLDLLKKHDPAIPNERKPVFLANYSILKNYSTDQFMALMLDLVIKLDSDALDALVKFKTDCASAIVPSPSASAPSLPISIDVNELLNSMDNWVKGKLLEHQQNNDAPLSGLDQLIQSGIQQVMLRSIGQTRMIKSEVLFGQVKKLLKSDPQIDIDNPQIIMSYIKQQVVKMMLPTLFAELKENNMGEIEDLFALLENGYESSCHTDFSPYLKKIDQLVKNPKQDTLSRVEEAKKLMEDLISAEKDLRHPRVAPNLDVNVPLRRLDRLAFVLQPASDSKCVAIAIDHKNRNFIIGSNANDAAGENMSEENNRIAESIVTNIVSRLSLIQTTARSMDKLDRSLSKERRRPLILEEIKKLSLIERMSALGGYDSQEDVTAHLVKIIDSYIFEPAVFGCKTTEEVDELFKLRTDKGDPRQVIMVPHIEYVNTLRKHPQLAQLKVSGVHAEQLVIMRALLEKIPLTNGNVGISKPCCGVCAQLFEVYFTNMSTSSSHENIFPNTAHLINHTMTSTADIRMLKDSPLKRENSGCTPEQVPIPEGEGIVPKLKLDPNALEPFAIEQMRTSAGVISQGPFSPRFHKAVCSAEDRGLGAKSSQGLEQEICRQLSF